MLGYFDYLGSAPLDPRVRDVMVEAFTTEADVALLDDALEKLWATAA